MPANAALLAARLLLAFLFVSSGPFRRSPTSPAPPPISQGSVFPPRHWSPGRPACSNCSPASLVLVGLRTRVAALLLAAFSLAAGFIGHYGQGGDDPTLAFMHSQALMKDVAIAGGFLALAVAGRGRLVGRRLAAAERP